MSDQRGRVRGEDLGAALAVLEVAFGPVEVLTVEATPPATGPPAAQRPLFEPGT